MPDSRTIALEAALFAVVATLVYTLLGQHTWYGYDGITYLHQAMLGHGDVYQYVYRALLGLAADAGATLGIRPYEAALAISTSAAGVSVGFCHVIAIRIGFGRVLARTVAALFATCPAVVFFATTVEVHAVFLAAAAPSWWAIVEYVRRPSFARGCVVLVLLTVAYLAHPTGAAYGALLPVFWRIGHDLTGIVGSERSFGRAVAGFISIGVTLGAIVGMLPFFRPLLGFTPGALGFVMRLADTREPESEPLAIVAGLAGVTVTDWLLPLAPLSLATLAALFAPRWRPAAMWTLALVGLLVGTGWGMLHDQSEWGAYFLPLALPGAMFVAAAVRHVPLVGLGSAALSLAGGIGWIAAHDDSDRLREVAAGMKEIAGDDELVLLTCDRESLAAGLMHVVDEPTDVHDSVFHLIYTCAQPLEIAVQRFRELERRAADGACLLLPTASLTNLREAMISGRITLDTDADLHAPSPPATPLVLHLLENGFALEPVSAREFEGFRLSEGDD